MTAENAIDQPRRLLLIKPSALGDVVTALPALDALKRHWPDLHVTWLIREAFAPLIEHDSRVDARITYNRRLLGRFWRSRAAWRHLMSVKAMLADQEFDVALDMQGLARSGYFTKWSRAPLRVGFADARELAWRHYNRRIRPERPHTVDRNLALAADLGVPIDQARMRLEIHPPSGDHVRAMLESHALAAGSYAAIAPVTTWATKQYPLRHWRKVAELLTDTLPVVLLGTEADEPFCREIANRLDGVISLAGRTDVRQLAAAVQMAAVAACCDSACKFIAQAVDTPCLTLLGPTRDRETGPWPGATVKSASIPAPTACQGCKKKTCRHISCMQLIPPRQVVEAIEDLLANQDHAAPIRME
jgi:lipopolysaccharide heptosyltransferase I